MSNLLDLMSKEDRERAIEKGRKRLEKKQGSSISPEIYMVAEFGYYFGWEGIEAIKRGYIQKLNDKGDVVNEPFVLDEVIVLLEAARKVWYTKLVENANSTLIATHSSHTKSPSDSFKKGMKDFRERSKL